MGLYDNYVRCLMYINIFEIRKRERKEGLSLNTPIVIRIEPFTLDTKLRLRFANVMMECFDILDHNVQ